MRTPPLYLLALLTFPPAMAQDLNPETPLSQFNVERWDHEDGLAANAVYSLAKTADGYLWLATSDGLYRFDGARFHAFHARHHEAFTTDAVLTVTGGRRDGDDLWVGLGDGSLLVRRRGRFVRLVDPDPETADGVTALLEDRGGDVWVWRDLSGVRRYRRSGGALEDIGLPGGIVLDLPPQSIPWPAMLEDRAGNVWLGSQGGGLYRLGAGDSRHFTTADGLNDDFVHSLGYDADGSLWIGTDGGVNRYENGRWHDMSAELDLTPPGGVEAFHLDDNGALWFAETGIFRRWGGQLEKLEGADGAGDDFRLLGDGHGLWIGSNSGTLLCVHDLGIVPFGPAEGLRDTVVLAVTSDRAGRRWLGTSRGGLVALEGEDLRRATVERYTVADGLPHDRVWAIHETARDGDFRLGTNGGFVRFTADGSGGYRVGRVTTSADGLSDDWVRVILEDEPDRFWLGTIRGGVNLLREDGGGARVVRSWTMADGLPHDSVRWLHRDRRGDLWVGFSNGLARMRGSAPEGLEIETFGLADGLLSTRARAVYEDAAGELWMGFSGGGLSRYQPDGERAFRSYSRTAGLPTSDVWGILEDGDGGFWLSADSGLARVRRRDLDAFDAGEIDRVPGRVFHAPALEEAGCCNAGGDPTVWKDADGTLLLPGVHGIVVVDPRRAARPVAVRTPRIESVLVGGEAFHPADLDALPSGVHEVQVVYTSPNLAAAGDLTFRYRLREDEDWIDAGPRRVAYFTHLSPGTYRFEVQARAAGEWSESAVFRLAIRPQWWERTALRFLLVLILLAIPVAWVLSILGRNRRLDAAGRALADQIEENERVQKELRVEREHLAHVSRVNILGEMVAAVAHELNQPLAAISANARAAQRFLGHEEPAYDEIPEILEDVVGDCHRAAEVIRGLRPLMKKEPLRPESLSLNAVVRDTVRLVGIEARFENVDLLLELAPDDPMVEADRVHLQQVLVNLMHNAIEALQAIAAGERRLVVGTACRNDQAFFEVCDNGPGFGGQDAETLFAPFETTKADGLGIGLAICRSIVAAHDGRIEAEENPEGGVTVRVTLPKKPK